MSVPDNLEQITCSSCGTSLMIEHGEGYVALIVAEKLTKAIEESGFATQEAIRDNTKATLSEFKRIQMTQELTALQMEHSSVQAEIRILRTTVASSTPKGLKARLELFEQRQLLSELSKRSNELEYIISDLKLSILKEKFPSFSKQDPPFNNQAQIGAFRVYLDEEEEKLRKYRNTPEGRTLHDQLLQRQKNLRESWNRFEVLRIEGVLNSSGYQTDQEDLGSLTEYLERIDLDLQKISREPSNEIVMGMQTKLQGDRERINKKIQKLKRKLERSNTPSFFAALFASLTAFLGGLALSSRKKSKSPESISRVSLSASNPVISQAVSTPEFLPTSPLSVASPQITTIPVNQAEDSFSEPASLPLEVISPFSSSPKMEGDASPVVTSHQTDIVPFSVGCISALVILFITVGLGDLLFIKNAPTQMSELEDMIYSWAMSLGVLLGGRVFLWLVAPKFWIKGFLFLPAIVINRKKSGAGIRSFGLVKLSLGLIVFVSLFIFFSAFLRFNTEMNMVLNCLLITCLFILSPLSSIMVALRASQDDPAPVKGITT
jgi:hypothetical protein